MPKAKESKVEYKKEWKNKGGGMGSGVYGMGFIGAAIYYIQHAQSFSAGVVGVLKAAFWPAFLVYKLIELLKF